jgi:hypothetical protein
LGRLRGLSLGLLARLGSALGSFLDGVQNSLRKDLLTGEAEGRKYNNGHD